MRKLAPLYPLLFSAYPAVALLSHNIQEVSWDAVLRPIVLSMLLAVLLLALGRVALGSWERAGLFAAPVVLVVLGYGHFYSYLKDGLGLPPSVVRHRFLAPALTGLLAVWIVVLRRARINLVEVNRAALVAAAALLALPLYGIARYVWLEERGPVDPSARLGEGSVLSRAQGAVLPDIYYIILDTYTRGDTLAKEYGLDTSPFLRRLEELGFFIADCSRANYPGTALSLTTSLNLNYLPALAEELQEQSLPEGQYWRLLKHSAVRAMLEDIGYRTIAFDTGYQWSRLEDADLYLGPTSEKLKLTGLEPFDSMFLKSTAALIVFDYWHQQPSEFAETLEAAMTAVDFPHRGFVRRELYILETLPTLAGIPGPKFVFAHVLIPHVPRVFGPKGEIMADPRYYSGEGLGAANPEFDIRGYLNEIQFINSRILEIIETILAESASPPIVILQGDTGRGGQDTFEILNAYYTMGERNPSLYSSISPVNTFRALFTSYFGADFPLLPDKSFNHTEEIEERWPHCLPSAG